MPAASTETSICVLGAGVSGLTTALTLLRRKYQVTILTSGRNRETTSSAAAAFWYPFWTGKKPDHTWYRTEWALETYCELEKLVSDQDSGVTRIGLVEYFEETMSDAEVEKTIASMWWRHISKLKFETLDPPWPHDPALSAYNRFKKAIRFDTLVINMVDYLPFLNDLVVQAGGQIEPLRMVETRDLESLVWKYDYVVNCTGLGAQTLVNDAWMKAKEGIVVKVTPAEGISDIVLMHTGGTFGGAHPFYIVPRGGKRPDVLLGGTINIKESNLQPRHFDWGAIPAEEHTVEDAARAIVQRCEAVCPSIRSSERLDISIGYRPAREKPAEKATAELGQDGVRLGPNWETSPGPRLIHNYGHGGGGVTLSWGCAEAVATWIDRLEASL